MSTIEEQRRQWSRRINSVFHVNARDGSRRGTVWLPRQDLESRLANLLGFSGVHICVDGGSGTGKSSLVLTGLHREKRKYVLVQLTDGMSWSAFCQCLVTVPSTRESSYSAALDVGIAGIVPTGRLQVSLASTHRPSDSVGLSEKIASGWTEHDVCRKMLEQDTTLFIDDFEYASDEIILRTANMCKLLTESYISPAAKMIVVGASDVYRRLFRIKPTLESRLEEVSLGTLSNANASWKFLQMGFEELGLTHPANDRYVSREENHMCIRAMYEAADGLPKALNVLGREISLRGFQRTRVTPADVRDAAEEMPIKAISRFRQEFAQIMKLVEDSAATRIVLQHLYETGIGQVHYRDEITSTLRGKLPEEQLDVAIQQLVSVNFLIQTGKSGNVLFATDPSIGHSLGVVIENPEKYGQRPEKYAAMGQLTLPFRFDS